MLFLTMIEGSVAAIGCIAITVVAIWRIMTPQTANLYILVSWFMIGLTICVMGVIALLGGWVAATSFAITYILLTFVPLFVGFHVGVDAISCLVVGSIIITIEIMIIIMLQLIQKFR
jgi:hypothetical protein